jgi:hypothetical protein
MWYDEKGGNETKISKSSNWEEGRLPKKEKARKSIE